MKTKPNLIDRFKRLAERNARRRKDPRFFDTMGFLVAKGFLGYNRPILPRPNARLELRDAIWAGTYVEPRILEVLPAAVARLPKNFRIPEKPARDEAKLVEIAEALREGTETEVCFHEIGPEKYRVWMDLPLKDGRTVPVKERKRAKNFRLRPIVIDRLEALAKAENLSETEVLERIVLEARERTR
ncbi:MAG: hypothetical protein JST04_08255 [Bdellovibrionales bacterium]|nr:hypothetical protein [Bdellovibrionales bacterium]